MLILLPSESVMHLPVYVPRAQASQPVAVASGREAILSIGSQNDRFYQDSLKYTFGESGRVTLFAFGDSYNKVEFRSPLRDTALASDASVAAVRFLHMAGTTGVGFYEVEVFANDLNLFSTFFEPGGGSRGYVLLQPGSYTFELRELGTPNVLVKFANVQLSKGQAYTFYSFDEYPPGSGKIGLTFLTPRN